MQLHRGDINKILYKNISRYFIIFSFITFLISYGFYMINYNYTKDILKDSQEIQSEIIKNTIENEFENIIGDLKYLYDKEELSQYINTFNEKHLATLKNDIYTFSNSKKIYNQIRILNTDGDEIIKVTYDDNKPHIKGPSELSNKKHRYYFDKAMELKKGELYISPLDLNVEKGQLEFPYKPTIRFATPLFDSSGNKQGVLVLNYYGKYMINKINVRYSQSIYRFLTPQLMLLNNDGYWLMSNNTDKNWTFMIPQKKHISFKSQYNDAWENISNNKYGVFSDNNGVFTYSTVYPTNGYTRLNNRCNFSNDYCSIVYSSDYSWKLVLYIDQYALTQIKKHVLNKFIKWGAVIFITTFILSIILAYVDLNLKLTKRKLQNDARTDTLTGLYNRRAGLHILRNKIYDLHDKRPLSISYLDINNLKKVNDIYGHKEGDFLICEICSIIKDNIRTTDIFCRLGGDEFLIIFDNCTEHQAKKVITKIKIKLSQYTRNSDKNYTFAVSAGICEYNSQLFESIEAFIENADKKMYVDKQNYKKNK